MKKKKTGGGWVGVRTAGNQVLIYRIKTNLIYFHFFQAELKDRYFTYKEELILP